MTFDPVAHNRAAWDREVDSGNEWTRPVGPGRHRPGPGRRLVGGADRLRADAAGLVPGRSDRRRRCSAWPPAAGSRARCWPRPGAEVTVLDNSPRQLARDQEVAAREGLAIHTVLGDMRDLSAFPDASFDVVVNPVSNVFCPELAPVWREAFRVLRPGGVLLAGFMNPDIFIFDITALERGRAGGAPPAAVQHARPA